MEGEGVWRPFLTCSHQELEDEWRGMEGCEVRNGEKYQLIEEQ
jgi:hypothetical protein